MYEVRYGTPERWRSLKTNNEVQAWLFFDHCVKFAESHNLKWSIALWEQGWKVRVART